MGFSQMDKITLKLVITPLDYQTLQFCLKNSWSNYQKNLENPKCSLAFKDIINNMESLLDTKFKRVIGE
jgi:hypothetical protein